MQLFVLVDERQRIPRALFVTQDIRMVLLALGKTLLLHDPNVKQITWAELERKVRLLSTYLTQIPSLQRGDRLGVLGQNSAEYLQVRSNARRDR